MRIRVRGQEAPIELVIGIIILLASMGIALAVMGNASKTRCVSELRGQIDTLKLAMQDLSIQSPPSMRKVFFTMPSCGGDSVDVIRFVYYNREINCRACPGHYSSCWKIEPYSYETSTQKYLQSATLIQTEACIDLAGAITLIDENSAGNNACMPLSDSPCITPGCTADQAGLVDALMPSGRVASYRTFGRFDSDGNPTSRKFEITLRKTVVAGGGACDGSECGAILICVKPCGVAGAQC
ncbi:MAG: hypothetical protein V1787_05085 [Candidatus Micrarchaeota archaeon]